MSASPEMVALVDALEATARRRGDVVSMDAATYKAAGVDRDEAESALLAAIAKIEAARDEATRRLAVVEEAVRVALAQLNDDRNNTAMDTLRAALEKQP